MADGLPDNLCVHPIKGTQLTGPAIWSIMPPGFRVFRHDWLTYGVDFTFSAPIAGAIVSFRTRVISMRVSPRTGHSDSDRLGTAITFVQGRAMANRRSAACPHEPAWDDGVLMSALGVCQALSKIELRSIAAPLDGAAACRNLAALGSNRGSLCSYRGAQEALFRASHRGVRRY